MIMAFAWTIVTELKIYIVLFSFKLSITYNNFVNYTFVNKNETLKHLYFSPCLIPPEFW